jgi:ATP-dependent RNA helicase HelY
MKKRYYHNSPKRPGREASPKPDIPSMKPGSDKSLKAVFKKIGVPAHAEFKPDSFQLKALEAIKISDCLVTAPTGAGKTWIAEQVAKDVVHKAGKVWYATPLKALTNSIYLRFIQLFGRENVGILTGDIKKNQDAAIVIGTTEILRNQLYDAMYTGEDLSCNMIILDEAHYIGDEQRGVVWEEIIIYLPVRIPLLLLTATIGNPDAIAGWMESIRGKKCYVIENYKRPVPLFPLFFHSSGTLFPLTQDLTQNPDSGNERVLHKKVLKFADKKKNGKFFNALPPFGDILEILHHYDLLPAIFFLKSRAECDKAMKLCHPRLLSKNPEREKALKIRMEELVSNHAHLENHRQRLWLELTATASHHSGHLPAWKTVVESLMAEGLLDAMFATSTVAAGVNFPARSVFTLNSDRFNGVDFLPLTPSELQQMSGRAGRRGMDNIGFFIVMPGNYMDLKHIINLINSSASDIESQITINFSMVLNLLLSHTPEQIKMILEKSFASYLILSGKKKGKIARKKYGSGLELLWLDFMDHMNFLKAEGFVTENGKLTNDGLWASKLRIDSPVLVAQAIRDNLLPQNDPALLAAVTAAFVNEKEFNDDPLYRRAISQKLKESFLNIRKGLKPFALNLLQQGFDAPNLFVQPALLLYHWAHDADWEEISTRYGFTEGDFARLILRTAENLRQIASLEDSFPELAQTADRAVGLILKEPVLF